MRHEQAGLPNALAVIEEQRAFVAAWSKSAMPVAEPKLGPLSCNGCTVGGCCKQPILCTYLDAIPIALHIDRLGLNTEALRHEYAANGERMERVTAAGTEDTYDGQCPFLTGAHHCSVYEDRPTICRAYYVFGGTGQCVPPAHGGPKAKVCTLDHGQPVGRSLEMAMQVAEQMGRDRQPYIRGIGINVALVLDALALPAHLFWDVVLSGAVMPADRFARMYERQAADMPVKEVL
jgi:Fe-S-cluster containining protein